MHELRTKLGEDGRIIIPSIYRKQLNLKLGTEWVISIKNNGLNLLSTEALLKKAQALVKNMLVTKASLLGLSEYAQKKRVVKNKIVIDASALLALLNEEPGSEVVKAHLPDGSCQQSI